MTTSLNEEAVQSNESFERDSTIVDSIRTVLLHHSLSQDNREVIRRDSLIPRLLIPSGQFFCTTACHKYIREAIRGNQDSRVYSN